MKTKKSLLILLLMTFSLFASCSSNAFSHLFSPSEEGDTYYVVEFNSDGGTYVEPQKLEFGEIATRPKDPEKTLGYFKYEFAGWYKNNEDTPFDFENTPIYEDTYLRAKWNGTAPEKDAYHFKFVGTNCLVNNLDTYEIDVPAYAPAQFMITPKDSSYLLPDEVTIEGAGKEKVTYTPGSGVISISQMTSDITITASATKIGEYQFSFTGTNCKIGDTNPYVVDIKEGEQLHFTIKADSLYDTPKTIEIAEGENVSYKNGVITISEVTGNVTITATSHVANYNSISFNGIHCKADINESGINADYNYLAKKYTDEEILVLHLFPDEGYQLPSPETVRVSFFKPGNYCSNEEDYIYNPDDKTLTILKEGYDAVISLVAEAIESDYRMVTFDANGGTYFDGITKFQIQVNNGESLPNLLHTIGAPTLDDNLFGYYTYLNGSKIGYNSIVDEDIVLIAHYFSGNAPYDNLNNVSWDQIKQVGITNSNPYGCFKLGATKTLAFNTKNHLVRLIGTNHDTISGTTKKANFTFEFATVLSVADGSSYTCHWDDRSGSDTKNYDFIGSTLNTTLTNQVLPMLYDIKDYIEPVNKKSGRNATTYSTYLFPLAYDEIMNHRSAVPENEGEKYEYYKVHTSQKDRIKKNLDGDEASYWTRSPKTDKVQEAWLVWHDGSTFDPLVYYDSYAMAPAFCL